ncbi:MAG: MBL fold metallo-hydrolase [Mailhella sp.]|nr:MBL fold metallo-hydrolase [Mailhella sp.]
MRVTMLLDNIASDPGLAAEHGLSLYIETEKHLILFDTGQSDAFARNAEALGIDLAAVDIAVISHGHYDHTGGLSRFLQLNDHAPVYVHRGAFDRHGASDGRDIGMDTALAEHPRLVFTDGPLTIDDELRLDSFNQEERPFPSHSAGLFMFRDGLPMQDDFRHEQYLSIRERGRHIVISGCSHKGILNIMRWLAPDALVGGFHFMKLDADGCGRQELDKAAEALSQYDCRYCTCHCTGKAQFDYLKKKLGDRLHYLAGGMTIEL